MKTLLLPLTILALVPLAVAQTNLVKNADFEGKTAIPWTWTSTSTHVARIEGFDVTGKAKSKAFACTPYTTRLPLKQNVITVANQHYRFRMDVASLWPALASRQGDAGRFRVLLGSQVLLTYSFGAVTSSKPLLRAHLQAAFKAISSGKQPLTIEIYRIYGGLYGRTPRCYVDNVVLEMDPRPNATKYGTGCGPLFSASMLNSSLPYTLMQTVSAPAKPSIGIMVMGTKRLSLTLPGTTCKLFTNLIILTPYAFDSSGLWSSKIPLPSKFKGPVNVQHVIFTKVKTWKILTTDAYAIQ